MRPPVQIWSSLFWRGSHDAARTRDIQRALQEWQGDGRIWLDPHAKKSVAWPASRNQPQGLLIPSDTIDVIDVWHVDEHSRIWPHNKLAAQQGGSLASGVYRLWIDQQPLLYYQPSETLDILFPKVVGNQVQFEIRRARMQPGAPTPHTEMDDDGVLHVAWSPSGAKTIIDIGSEMEEATGPASYAREEDGLLTVESDRLPGTRALSTILGWKPPIDDLFPAGGGVDHLDHLARMRECVADSKIGKRSEALKEAERWVSHLSGRVTTNLYRSWFMPMRAATAALGEDEVLFAVESRFGIAADSLDMLHDDERFVAEMETHVEVTWLDGWLGYMWWEIYHDIIERMPVTTCENCGNMLRGGRKNRKYCRKDENPQCVKDRGAARQRSRRSRQSSG